MASALVIGLNFLSISLLVGFRQTESTHLVPVTQSSKASDAGLNILGLVFSHLVPVTQSSQASDDLSTNVVEQHRDIRDRVPLEADPDVDMDAAVAGLNILGIAISVPSAILGAPFLIIGSLLSLLFSRDQTTAMTRIVWNERVTNQRAKLLGIRERLQNIEELSNEGGDLHVANSRMLSLNDDLTSNACFFMYRDNVRSSSGYLKVFATLRLSVSQALIIGLPRNQTAHWKRKLDANVIELVAYGNYVIQEDIKVNRSSTMYMDLTPAIDKWLGQLNASRKRDVIESNQIRDGGIVSFKIVDGVDTWLSCFVPLSMCEMRDCPGVDNPMQLRSQNRWKCDAEVFTMHAAVADGPFVRSCSRVGMQFASHWWLSHNGGHTETVATCAGTTSLMAGQCRRQEWNITARGKPCGTVLTDRDLVDLRSVDGNRPVFSIRRHCVGAYGHAHCNYHEPAFVIFRSDVPHNSYVENLHCH